MITLVLVIVAIAVGFVVGLRRGRSEASPVTPPARVSVNEAKEDDDVMLQVRAALDSLTVGVVVVAANGAVVFRNVLARGLTGAVHADVLVDEAVDVHLRGALDGASRRQVLDLFGPPRKVVAVSATPLS
ncbi:MAG: hypothetical protein ACK49V_14075, partial [Actinomycetes bacterium]